MTQNRPTVVVEVRGPSRSGATSLMELLALHVQDMEVPVSCPSGKFDRMRFDLTRDLRSACCLVEVREAEPDDRDAELASLRQERDRLKQEVRSSRRRGRRPEMSVREREAIDWLLGRLETGHCCTPGCIYEEVVTSSSLVLTVRLPDGLHLSEDVVSRESKVLEGYVQLAIRTMLIQSGHYDLPCPVSLIPEHPSDDRALQLVRRAASLMTAPDGALSRYDRLLVAFHDALRRPLGVTPASGEEFYDHQACIDAEARRPRHDTPEQRSEVSERTRPLTDRSRGLLKLEYLANQVGHAGEHEVTLCRRSDLEEALALLGGPLI